MAGKTLREDNVIFNLVTKIDNADATKKLDKDAKGLEGSYKKAGLAFSSIVTVASVGIALVGIGKMVSKGLELAGTFEKTSVSFKTLTGSIKTAGNLVKELESFSVVTPFTPDEVLKAGKTLLAFGVSAGTVGDVINNLGEASAATGADMNNLAFIFGQARATGVLFTQDLNQLANAGLPILSLLADEMGVAEGNIRKLASEGKITFDILDSAFRRAAKEGGRFAGALKAQSETLEGLKSTAQGVRDAFFRAFGLRILKPAKDFQKALISIFTAAEKFVKLKFSDELREEKIQLNLLVQNINDVNTSQETRNELIFELQDKYPSFLGNLDAEKVTTEELTKRLKEVNAQYIARIALAVATERVEAAQADQTAEQTRAANAAQKARENIIRFLDLETNALTKKQIQDVNDTNILKEKIELLREFIDPSRFGISGTNVGADLISSLIRLTNQEIFALEEAEKATEALKIVEEARLQVRAQFSEELGTFDAQTVKEDAEAAEKLRIKAEREARLKAEAEDKKGKKIKIPEGGFRIPEDSGFNLFSSNLFSLPEDAPQQARDFMTEAIKLFVIEAEKLNAEMDLELSLGFFDTAGVDGGADPLATREEQFEQLAESAQIAADVIQDGFDAEIDRIDDLIDAQERRVDASREIAERGNAEQLQLEEERLNKLLEKRAAAQKRQQVIDGLSIISAQAVAAAESIKAITKGFGEGGLITGIATVVALAASIGAIVLTVSNAFGDIPSFDVGEENVAHDMMANIHKNERILTADQNAQIGNIKNEDIPSLVNAGLSVMNSDYLYKSNGEMVELLKENNDLNRSILDATYGDGLRISQYMNERQERGGYSSRQRNLLR